MTGTVEVRRLRADETTALKALRVEAMTLEAEIFSSDAEAERARPDSWFTERIAEGVLGAYADGVLVGMAGYTRATNPKQRRRATLYGMYLRADQRGRGPAGKLVAAVIEHARAEGAEVLLLATNTTNIPAISLYELAGFRQYGLEPGALKQLDGSYLDDVLYRLPLDA